MQTSLKGSNFIFDYVNFLHYKFCKINLKHDGLFLDSSDWIKNKKATINSINDDDECFRYATTVALYYKEIGRNSERISKIMPLINKHNLKGINYTSGKDDWKTLKKTIQ